MDIKRVYSFLCIHYPFVKLVNGIGLGMAPGGNVHVVQGFRAPGVGGGGGGARGGGSPGAGGGGVGGGGGPGVGGGGGVGGGRAPGAGGGNERHGAHLLTPLCIGGVHVVEGGGHG